MVGVHFNTMKKWISAGKAGAMKTTESRNKEEYGEP